MASNRSSRAGACAPLALALLLAAGCVEPFGGSNIQFTLTGSVDTPDPNGTPGVPGDYDRPPPGTHYEIHAVENVTDTDMDGNEVVVETFTFEVANFQVVQVIDPSSPCFIEDEESRFPGLHVTQYLAKLEEVTGVTDPYDPSVPEGDAIDILGAQVRMDNIAKLQVVKAVASHDPTPYPDDIPAPDLTDDASNRERRDKCEAFWADHPLKYEGSDKVFTLPLNGTWFGAVDGSDPRNGQFVGGAGFFVDTDLGNIDGMMINWQYDCDPADFQAKSTCGADARRPGSCAIACDPLYPDSVPDEERSDIGVHYMSGTAVSKTRGVINVPMTNRTFNRISGEAAIWFDLNDDEVQF